MNYYVREESKTHFFNSLKRMNCGIDGNEW